MDLKLILLIGAVVLIVLTAGALLLWRRTKKETRDLMARIGHLPLRSRFSLAWALLQDNRLPLTTRAIIPALVLYLALPIDIIPDFVPVLGQLDDVVVAVAAIGLLLRSTPRDVLEEHLGYLEHEAASTASSTPEIRRIT